MDKWVKTNDRDTFQMARRLIKEEGLLCGKNWGGINKWITIVDSSIVLADDKMRLKLSLKRAAGV